MVDDNEYQVIFKGKKPDYNIDKKKIIKMGPRCTDIPEIVSDLDHTC